MEQQTGLRRFMQGPLGRVLLIAIAIVVTAFTYAYLYALIAIPVMLIVGLMLPIYLGIKRIRFLAILGLVILLASAPIATIVLTQEVMTPIPPASSPTNFPGANGGALLQDASVSPYLGSTSTNFTWNVTVYERYVPAGNDSPYLLSLYISTCPGATGPNDPNCNAGYPFYTLNRTLAPLATNATEVVSFHFVFPSDGIWAWQMGAFLNNTTSPSTHNATFIQLVGDALYNGLEGPVVGGFLTTYEQLVLSVYLNVVVYLGIPFYVVLVIYLYIKRRQGARGSAAARAPGPVPSESPATDAPPAAGVPPVAPATTDASAPRRPEMPCPNCGAVVYPNETTCWKCGTKLPGGGSAAPPADAPLRSGGPPS